MSKYTTEVRYICEKYAGLNESADYLSIDDIISKARSTVFNFNYPIFNEDYRSVLECKILKHFYTREIGEETVALWKLRLNTRMNEIMPYYNQRYASELITFNPLFDTDLSTSRNDTFGSEKTENNLHNSTDGGTDNVAYDDRDNANDDRTVETWTNVNTTDWHYDSDTPQSTIASINDGNYATSFTKDVHIQGNDNLTSNSDNYQKSKDKSEHDNHNDTLTTYGKTNRYTENDKTNFNSSDAWFEHMVGKRSMKSYSQMLNEFRTTFLNIDMEIINELNDLFMNVW